jgi:hypothetical protein
MSDRVAYQNAFTPLYVFAKIYSTVQLKEWHLLQIYV